MTLWETFSLGEDPWVGLNGQQILRKIDQEGERLACPAACPTAIYDLLLEVTPHIGEMRDDQGLSSAVIQVDYW